LGIPREGIARDSFTARWGGERWIRETGKILSAFAGEEPDSVDEEKISARDIVKIGTPLYGNIMQLTYDGGRFNFSPRLLAQELAKIVEYGEVTLTFEETSDAYAKRTIIKAASYLPIRMVEKITEGIPGIDARAFLGRGLARLDDGCVTVKTNSVRTSLHELVHAWEYSHGNRAARQLSKEFYAYRTNDQKLRNLRNFVNVVLTLGLGGFSYGSNEKYMTGFVNAYMGKENGVEVYSSGMEYVFFDRFNIWQKDPEATKFILGSLIFWGR